MRDIKISVHPVSHRLEWRGWLGYSPALRATDYKCPHCIMIEYDGKGIDIKDWSSSKEDVDMRSQYRNISQLWHPAEEKPYSIGQILCQCSNGLCFVHHHYSDDDDEW